MKMLKLFVRSCVALLNRMLFVDQELVRCFILAPYRIGPHDDGIHLQLIFSSYFSIIFLAKGKFSKSISLFVSHIWPKRFWPIRWQDFESNISLEQIDEIVYFFCMLIPKVKSRWKILGWVWSQMFVALVTRLMDEWMN